MSCSKNTDLAVRKESASGNNRLAKRSGSIGMREGTKQQASSSTASLGKQESSSAPLEEKILEKRDCCSLLVMGAKRALIRGRERILSAGEGPFPFLQPTENEKGNKRNDASSLTSSTQGERVGSQN